MKEIKFRLRDRHNKIVGYEKWYLGVWSDAFQDWTAKPQWLYSQDGEKWNPYCLDFTSSQIRYKDQYIDLKDRHRQEIYEFDIVKAWHPDHSVYYRGSIEYDIEQSTWFLHRTGFACLPLFEYDEFEIIGNIYENPELLEGNH